MPRVLVAMSGGVDSSVAAALLVEQGYDVVGATMKLTCHGDELPDRPCCSLDSVNDARRVCDALGVPHYVLNLERAFTRDVVEDFAREYARGRTPIPCVRCNTFTKFRDLVARADAIDAEFVATGHYARVAAGALHRGVDPAKDQSYFLWGLRRSVLRRLLLPVGVLTKAETRRRARQLGLSMVAGKTESQDICFVPDGDHVAVVAARLGEADPSLQPGPIQLADGTTVGVHQGFARFTIGQRRGLPGGFAEPMFVIGIEPVRQAVIIGPRQQLLGESLRASEANWLSDRPAPGTPVLVQIRHRSPAVPAIVSEAGEATFGVVFQHPVRAITPGQSVVLYRGDHLVGGGVIESAALGSRALPVVAA
ncbi:MAG: tRNA 2-thiouridine(34) synthase MnmA [Gemmatimonadaceae bacterium]|nr:tRNA 2-thiouridine(34) synthase MnmA [Gemmatimonadaceae bacterium]